MAALVCPAPAHAQAATDAARDAHRALEIATLELQLYSQAEHPAELRRLDAKIQLTRAEVEAHQRLQQQYQAIRRFDRGNPLPLTVERVRLDLLAAELRLREAKAQRAAAQRFHPLRLRLLSLKVEQAAALAKLASPR
ncbi:MAG: hypothetical protein AAF790_13580 [Planctomycetota bacterium]